MKKEDLLEQFTSDFGKSRGALLEIISHNRRIDSVLVEDLTDGDFKKLEEHLEISKLILEATKGMTSMYKEIPSVLTTINKIEDPDEVKKEKLDIRDLLKGDD